MSQNGVAKQEKKRKSSLLVDAPVNTEFFIHAQTRQAFVDFINQDIVKNPLGDIGRVYNLSVEDSEKAYDIVVSIHPITQTLQYHAYDSKDKTLQLGEGGSGNVFAGQNIVTGDLAAIKVHNPFSITADLDIPREQRNHKVAKTLIGLAQTDNGEPITLMEYYRGYTLLETLYEIDGTKRDLDFVKMVELVTLAIDCVVWLHEEVKLAHRDIKSDNLVLVEQLKGTMLKLVDLGSAIFPSEKIKGQIAGTFGYIPPELLLPLDKQNYYDFPSDLFQLGVVLAEIATKCNYQQKLKEEKAKQQEADTLHELSLDEIKALMPDVFTLKLLGVPTAHVIAWERIINIISRLCELEPAKRLELYELKLENTQLKFNLQELKIKSTISSPRQKLVEYKELKRQNSKMLPDRQASKEKTESDEPKPSVRFRELKHAKEYDFVRRSFIATPAPIIPTSEPQEKEEQIHNQEEVLSGQVEGLTLSDTTDKKNKRKSLFTPFKSGTQ